MMDKQQPQLSEDTEYTLMTTVETKEEDKRIFRDIKEEEILLEINPDSGDTIVRNIKTKEENGPQQISTDPGVAIVRYVKTEEEEVFVKIKEEEISPPISTDFQVRNVKTEQEEVFVKIKEEEIPLQISSDGRYSENNTERQAAVSPDHEREDGITTESVGGLNTPDSRSALHPGDLSSNYSTQGQCFLSHTVTHATARKPSIKPYSCSECGKCFSFKSDLITHERTHTETERIAAASGIEFVMSKDNGSSNIPNQVNESPNISRKRKRNDVQSKFNRDLLAVEGRKVELLEKVLKKPNRENADSLFLKSLVPFMSQVSPNLKLQCRNKVHEVLKHFINLSNSGSSAGAGTSFNISE